MVSGTGKTNVEQVLSLPGGRTDRNLDELMERVEQGFERQPRQYPTDQDLETYDIEVGYDASHLYEDGEFLLEDDETDDDVYREMMEIDLERGMPRNRSKI